MVTPFTPGVGKLPPAGRKQPAKGIYAARQMLIKLKKKIYLAMPNNIVIKIPYINNILMIKVIYLFFPGMIMYT